MAGSLTSDPWAEGGTKLGKAVLLKINMESVFSRRIVIAFNLPSVLAKCLEEVKRVRGPGTQPPARPEYALQQALAVAAHRLVDVLKPAQLVCCQVLPAFRSAAVLRTVRVLIASPRLALPCLALLEVWF